MKRMIFASTSLVRNPRYQEYNQYLLEHISGVQRAWKEMLRPSIINNLSELGLTLDDVAKSDEVIPLHDKSKYQEDEYIPYCNYFYPTENFPKDKDAFNLGWLLHQRRNPHHHQYWVLLTDEGETRPMDMPIQYVCEMLCDWQSFSIKDGESPAKTWWEENKDGMTLSANTIKLINKLIKYLAEPLQVEVTI